jgi:hypothetical protein
MSCIAWKAASILRKGGGLRAFGLCWCSSIASTASREGHRLPRVRTRIWELLETCGWASVSLTATACRRRAAAAIHARAPFAAQALLLSVPFCYLVTSSGEIRCSDEKHIRPARRVQLHGQDLRHVARVVQRAVWLLCLLVPLIGTYSVANLHPCLRRLWLFFFSLSLQWCGPAFTKWGQWAAGRPDLLPVDIRTVLETLHTAAPTHSPYETLHTLKSVLPEPLEDLFEEFEVAPFASGAIAQVHRARLSKNGAARCGRSPGEVLLHYYLSSLYIDLTCFNCDAYCCLLRKCHK